MSLDPRKKRELVFLICFSMDLGEFTEEPDVVEMLSSECKVSKRYVLEAIQRARAVVESREACDQYLARGCSEYSVDGLTSVERTILRLAIFEGLIEKELSSKIVIAEAKRLTKKFSTDEAVPFVHAVLAALLSDEGEDEPA